MNQKQLRKTIDNDIQNHCKIIKRMGWVKPDKDELISYVFHRLTTGPRPCQPTPPLISEVHSAVNDLIRSKFYRTMA